MKTPLMRSARWLVVALLGLEVLYVVVMNVVLATGVIPRAASTNDGQVDAQFSWGPAWTPWPGRAYVRNFALQLADPAIEFRLTIDRASLDVGLFDLLHQRFTASHVRASGVRFELVTRVDAASKSEARLQAFALLDGFARPALLADPPVPALTPAQLALLWAVRLDDVDATVEELWVDEFRYEGPGHLQGGFRFWPLHHLQLDSIELELAPTPRTSSSSGCGPRRRRSSPAWSRSASASPSAGVSCAPSPRPTRAGARSGSVRTRSSTPRSSRRANTWCTS
jgi:hypothetical protein